MQFLRIGQKTKPLALQNLTERVTHEIAIHGPVQQALCDDRLVAQRPELYFIPLRY